MKKCLVILLCIIGGYCYSQQSLDSFLSKIDVQKLSASVDKKVSKLEDKIIAKSEKTLDRLQKQEEKIYTKQLSTKDSLIAKAKLQEIKSKYEQLKNQLKNPVGLAKQYIPHLDTLQTAFKFLNQNGSDLSKSLSKIESFDGKMQQAE